jgi:hypothetical protein
MIKVFNSLLNKIEIVFYVKNDLGSLKNASQNKKKEQTSLQCNLKKLKLKKYFKNILTSLRKNNK